MVFSPTKRQLAAGFALAAAVALGWAIWARKAPDADAARRGGPVAVAAAAAGTGDVEIVRNALGTVTPLAAVTVRPQISGQLVEVAFTEGQSVKKGDFLAQIDPRPYQVQLEQYSAQIARDRALLANAKTDLARYRTLAAQDSIARQTLDTQTALVSQNESTVAADQALVDTAKLNLTYCRITAPVSGRLGLRQVDPGNYVQTADAAGIVVITQMRPMSVVFSLPEDDLPAVLKRMREGTELAVEAFDRGRSRRLATGHLATVDNQINTATGTVKLRAVFDNADLALFPNQFVNVVLRLDTLKGVVVVPEAAVQHGVPGTFVYLVRPDGTVTVRKILVGPSAGERVAVTEGLSPGDKVVVDGVEKLRDGAAIRLPAGDGAPAAGTAARGGK